METYEGRNPRRDAAMRAVFERAIARDERDVLPVRRGARSGGAVRRPCSLCRGPAAAGARARADGLCRACARKIGP